MIPGIVAGQKLAVGALPSTIGQAFGGGYYVGDVTVGASIYAVIIAGSGAEVTRQWKTANTSTSGTNSAVDGVSNTASMIAAGSHAAATYCDDYVSGSYSDWYLPSRDELTLAWTNRALLGSLAMAADYYASSTEYDSGNFTAVSLYFNGVGSSAKTNTGRVRPTRRLLK